MVETKMFGLTRRRVVFLFAGLVAFSPLAGADEPGQSEREAMYSRYLDFASYVKGGSIGLDRFITIL